jgi:hypothetical protein
VPAFLAGVLAVAGIAVAIPLRSGGEANHLDRDVARLRRALEQGEPALEGVLFLAQKVVARTEDDPDRAGEAHFLLGSIYQRLGDQNPPPPTDDARRQALTHLEQAEKLGVPPTDQDKLTFRLGKAWFQNGCHLRRAIDYLERSVVLAADDQADGYAMLAQAYLRLPRPDLRAAYDANLKLLALPTDDEDVLGPARLRCAEIRLQQQQPAEALEMLKTIRTGAPPEALARARYLQARCCQELHLWADAIPFWLEVLRHLTGAPKERGQVLYYLGVCYHHLDPPDEESAAKAWAKAQRRGGESGRAAALCLAEASLASHPDEALQAFGRGLEGVRAEDYRSSLIDLDGVRTLIERACTTLRGRKDFERALRLAELYQKVAAGGAAQDLQGQLAQDWARELEAQPRPASEAKAAARTAQVRRHWQQAGSAYEAAATLLPAAQRPKLLWAAATSFLNGRFYANAATVLDQFLGLKVDEEWRGEGWYLLGEARMAQAREEPGRKVALRRQANVAYLKAIEYPGPSAPRARYQLARAELERSPLPDAGAERARLDNVQAMLKQNLEPRVKLTAPDAYEKSLFELAGLAFRRENYRYAIIKLVEAISDYRTNPHIWLARYQLAESYRQLAEDRKRFLAGNARLSANFQAQARQDREKSLKDALDNYQPLADDLDTKAKALSHLTTQERALLRKALFTIAYLHFESGNYAEAFRRYQALVRRYHQELDERMWACRGMWRCCGALDGKEAQDALKATREAFLRSKADLEAAARVSPGGGKSHVDYWKKEVAGVLGQMAHQTTAAFGDGG